MQTYVRTPLDIFAAPQHLVVPVFQRRYVWNEEDQWAPLWSDIRHVAERMMAGTSVTHFLGAIVTQAAPAALGSLTQHQLVDGQQRLTTLQVLLDAAAAELTTAGDARLADHLNSLTHNLTGISLDENSRLKLVHHNHDGEAFRSVMLAEPPISYVDLDSSPIIDAHRFFADQVAEWIGDPYQPARGQALAAALTQGLSIAVIALNTDEPSQEIFETLNARGAPLTAADLVKNYVFQRVQAEGGDAHRAYAEYWRDLESPFWRQEVRVGAYSIERLSVFLNYWLVAQTGEEISTRSTFTRFKSWFESSGRQMSWVLTALHGQADLFRQWTVEASRPDGDIGQIPLFLYRAQAADVDVVKTLLMFLYDAERGIPEDVASRALASVESWVMRRAIMRLPGSEYTRAVAALVAEMMATEPGLVDEAVRRSLQAFNRASNYWPSDTMLAANLREQPIYLQPKSRVRAYLEAVEDAMRGYVTQGSSGPGRTRRGTLTVEHLLPQNWRPYWNVESPEDQVAREGAVHVLGNLTLLTQSLNSSVSNGPWGEKRSSLTGSDPLLMTRGPRGQQTWDEERIHARTGALTERLIATWPVPDGHEVEVVLRRQAFTRDNVSVRDLLTAGLLHVGQTLQGRNGFEATLLEDGSFKLGGERRTSPTGAAQFAAGPGWTQGWAFWRTAAGATLSDLRRDFLSTQDAVNDRRGPVIEHQAPPA